VARYRQVRVRVVQEAVPQAMRTSCNDEHAIANLPE
jgi:hypothetical protein